MLVFVFYANTNFGVLSDNQSDHAEEGILHNFAEYWYNNFAQYQNLKKPTCEVEYELSFNMEYLSEILKKLFCFFVLGDESTNRNFNNGYAIIEFNTYFSKYTFAIDTNMNVWYLDNEKGEWERQYTHYGYYSYDNPIVLPLSGENEQFWDMTKYSFVTDSNNNIWDYHRSQSKDDKSKTHNKINKKDKSKQYNNIAKVYTNNIDASNISSSEKCIYTFHTQNENNKLFYKYRKELFTTQSHGKLAYDDEFKILGVIYSVIYNIIQRKCGNTSFKNVNINLFTYMDMCPSCWTIWNKCYDDLKQLYNTNELKVNVYSMKPYDFFGHVFVNQYEKKYERSKKNTILNSIIPITDFDKENTCIRRNNAKHTSKINQYIDINNIKILKSFYNSIIMKDNIYHDKFTQLITCYNSISGAIKLNSIDDIKKCNTYDIYELNLLKQILLSLRDYNLKALNAKLKKYVEHYFLKVFQIMWIKLLNVDPDQENVMMEMSQQGLKIITTELQSEISNNNINEYFENNINNN